MGRISIIERIGKDWKNWQELPRIDKDWQDNLLKKILMEVQSPDREPPEANIVDIGAKILLLENCSLGSSKARSILGYYIFIFPFCDTGCFFNWYPPKKLKYVKPRLGESTLT